MRRSIILFFVCGAARAAAADPVITSGSLGAGMVGTQPVATASAELDLERPGLSLGVGLDLRLDDGGLLDGDWDEWRDGARLLHHFTWRRAVGSGALSVAAGQLGPVEVGHGSLVDGLAQSIEEGRATLGVEARGRLAGAAVHAFVDDAIAPAVAGGRIGGAASKHLALGASAAFDTGIRGPEPVAALAVDAEVSGAGGPVEGGIYLEGVRLQGMGEGVHLGARGALVSQRGGRVGLRAEASWGSEGYVPGWFGALYLRDRDQLGDAAGAMDQRAWATANGGGLAGLVELEIARPDLGLLRARIDTGRPGGRGARLTFSAPSWRWLQAGTWAALSESGAGIAGELRARFPRHLFARLEAARLYRREATDEMTTWRPIWTLGAAFGAVFGEK